MNMMNKYVDLEKVVEESGLASTRHRRVYTCLKPAAC